ncbi:hypothetical protein ACR3K2_18310 [Cryptosporidium serpentis]
MINFFESLGCGVCSRGCGEVVRDLKKSERIEYGVFVGYYSDDDETQSKSNDTEPKFQEQSDVESEVFDAVIEEKEESLINDMFNEVASGGICNMEQANHLVHRIGLSPSNGDIEKLENITGGRITLDDFVKWTLTITHPEDHVDYMASFFRNYDSKGDGMITKKQFLWLTAIGGDILTREEAEAILSKFSLGDRFNYTEFLTTLMNVEASDKPMINTNFKSKLPCKDGSGKVLVSQISTTIRELADTETFLPSIDLLEALKATYGSQLTIEAANKVCEGCEYPEETAKYLIQFYNEWTVNKSQVTRKAVRDLLMVWKAKLDQVSAEAWITSLCGTDEVIDIDKVLKTVENQRQDQNSHTEHN